MSEYLRMSGIYWCLTTMSLIKKLGIMNKDEVLAFIDSCRHESGGYSPSVGHDPHLLHTLSAIQVSISNQFWLLETLHNSIKTVTF